MKFITKKMNKQIIKDIELIIKDLNLNGLLTNQDLLNTISKNNIKEIIINMINSIHNINNYINDIDKNIDSLLETTIKVYNPIYDSKQLKYINNIIKEPRNGMNSVIID